jgi:dGTPase
MDLNKLYSSQRTGNENPTNTNDPRSEYQRDFDRIIFSSAFRRLQNKTQVFPLPGSVFVHNRLTHSLEVASVGRSLGTLIGKKIVEKYNNQLIDSSKNFYEHELKNVIAAACLCHDIGNPAFGHSGEDAISSFFVENENELKKNFNNNKEWEDLKNFEGNANSIRVLTHNQKGKMEGGLRLTYSTLSAIAKYPCESTGINKSYIQRKKFGFFQSEKEIFTKIAKETGMRKTNDDPIVYSRHPFVWIVEAADDICYNIIDLEDAHRIGIIDHEICQDILHKLVNCLYLNNDFSEQNTINTIKKNLEKITDKNDKISYLRSKAINALIMKSVEYYICNLNNILNGTLNESIFNLIKNNCIGLNTITKFSLENIYNHRKVVEIENAGYNVMHELLSLFIFPILKDKQKRTQREKKALELVPKSFIDDDSNASNYQKVISIIDFISGMTDNYATDLYKRIKGIEIGMNL